MSTWLYLACLDHEPRLLAEEESGQHLYDLPQIRADLASRDDLVRAVVQDDMTVDDYFRRHTVRFLVQHPKCRIGIEDEYGVKHEVTEANT